MFADDVKLQRKVTNNADRVAFQKDINSLADWALRHRLPINFVKSFAVHFGYRNANYEYQLEGRKLPVEQSFRDLGVQRNSLLSRSSHCCYIAAKASRLCGLFLRRFVSRSPSFLVPVFQTFIRPILESASSA